MRNSGGSVMQTIKFVHWKHENTFLGYLVEYPDYWTQGDSLDELKDHLVDLFRDLTSGELSGIRKVDELVLP
jgi:predicted RNase H-like HicB family nuclease